MPNNLARFAINADDVSRARRFYEQVFGWRFEPWGPPDFYLIHTGDEKEPGVGGLLHQRRELVKGVRMIGYECTIGVDDIHETISALGAANGKIAMPKFSNGTASGLLRAATGKSRLVSNSIEPT